jgi:hypothetical protein
MIRTLPPRLAACAAPLSLIGALLLPLVVQAQVTVGNSVFPQAGDTLHYALDRSPGPEIQIGPAGFGETWDFSSLAWQTTWNETLRPAATGTGAEFFGDATLVYAQTGPASVNFPLLPGSNGSEAYLQVTNDEVRLLGFHGGSDAPQLGVGAFVKSTEACNGDPSCTPDLRTVFMTRYAPLALTYAPIQFFDVKLHSGYVLEEYPGIDVQGFPFTADSFRIRVNTNRFQYVDAIGTLVLPNGNSFEVLRRRTTEQVEVRLDANVRPLGWLDVTDLAIQYGIGPDVRWGPWEQYTFDFIDALFKETLATTYSPIAPDGQADMTAIEQVRFVNLAYVPEPQTAPLLLAGLIALRRLARKSRG